MIVGDYVRTKKGISRITTIDNEQIRKIIYTDTKEVFEYYTDKQGNEIKDYWKSYSSNIIDLIEVGDYVNGCLVLHKENNELVCGLLLRYKEENIQNVVTKEQFEAMKYEIK